MPVTTEYYPTSTVQNSPSLSNATYTRRSGPSSFKPDSDRYNDAYYAQRGRAEGTSYAAEHTRSPPQRSPSLLRRINSAIKSKASSSSSPSPSTSSTRLDSSSRHEDSTKTPRGDPMFVAPSSSGSVRLPSLPMNPVSRFRRARNEGKNAREREKERERTEQSSLPREQRVDARIGQSVPDHRSPTSSRSRSETRGHRATGSEALQDVYFKPGEPSRHARAESDGNWEEGRARRRGTPAVQNQTSEPVVRSRSTVMPTPPASTSQSRSSLAHRDQTFASEPIVRSNTSPRPTISTSTSYSRTSPTYREQSYTPTERQVSYRSTRRIYNGAGDSEVTTNNPPRMGKYGVYASPPASIAQLSHTSTRELPRPSGQDGTMERRAPMKRVEGWEVQISPPGTDTVQSTRELKAEPTVRPRAPTRTHTIDTSSPSLTLVAEHPLMENKPQRRELSSPQRSTNAAESEAFAINLTNRMQTIMNRRSAFFDPDTISIPPSEPGFEPNDLTDAAQSDSTSTSGTATPTGPRKTDEATRPAEEVPEAPTVNDTGAGSPFAGFFSNAKEMNDAFMQGTVSVWDKLFNKDKGKGKNKEGTSDSANNSDSTSTTNEATQKVPAREPEIEGAHDIMLYSPLIPDAGSLVEVATSEVVTLYGDGADEARERAYRAELRRRWADGRGFVSFDALSMIEPVEEERGEEHQPQVQLQTEVDADEGPVPAAEQNAEESANAIAQKPKEKVIWMPSPTQISVQVLWWGYRIYLPPPVLEVLNSRSVETAKRAALLTSALTWLLENLPMAALPVALAPAALLLKALVPLLGMIGTFVAWSWKATVTFDRGNGVVLSATWVLPIVLVPGTWEDGNATRTGIPPPCEDIDENGGGSSVAGPSRNRDI